MAIKYHFGYRSLAQTAEHWNASLTARVFAPMTQLLDSLLDFLEFIFYLLIQIAPDLYLSPTFRSPFGAQGMWSITSLILGAN